MQFAATLAEVHTMSDQTPRNISALADHPVAKSVGVTLPLIRAAVLAVSVAAAIPTAHNLYYSWTTGIPYAQVPHRLAQYDLWMKNLDCKIEYRQLLTASGTKVDVGACPTSQDIAIKVSSTSGHATYEWIAFNDLQKPAAVGLLGLVIPPALAEEAPQSKAPVKVAENGLQVMCSVREGTQVVRVIQEGGKCYKEVVSMLRGSIDKKTEVPCTATCK